MGKSQLQSWSVGAGLLGTIVLASACGRREAEPAAGSVPAASAPSDAVATPHASKPAPAGARPTSGNAQTAPAGDLAWTMPPGWKEMPARAMRKATYQAPGVAGPAEVAVFYFGAGQGGDVEANIARWVQQFEALPPDQARRDQLEVRGFTVSTVRVARGSFLSGMPGGPTQAQENWGMNAAVVETPHGPYFFKMTGPAPTVDAEEGRFRALLESVKSGG